jgi:hypothetical protein
MKKPILFLAISLATLIVPAQTPEVTSWIINTTGATGYNNIPSNVQQVQYGTDNVYVSATCIPAYSIGPWPGNPNTPSNQNFVFKITRHPAVNPGMPTATPLGHIGLWTNGVSIFNALDAASYMNQNVWHQNAQYWEGTTFDNCLGHPAPNGEYHHHVSPTCLYDDTDSLHHSPLIGYAFDGFPIYGAYGYDQPMNPGAVRRMVSGYELRNITQRDTLPDGTPAPQAGPSVNAYYRLGAYVEDYAFTGAGDLDAFNGRYCMTPDYPNGIYAYFVTLDESLDPVYPYVIGPAYYGIVQSGNTGPNSGHNIPSEPVQTYLPTGIAEVPERGEYFYPNPVSHSLTILTHEREELFTITDVRGKTLLAGQFSAGNREHTVELSFLARGIYFLTLHGSGSVNMIIKQ